MVLIGASVITKAGKPLMARVFISDMTKARLEGLLDAFPKLIASDKSQRQHTFVETDSVRYVYHPLDNIYMVLITTKASNILEDLETLRLFSRVIPEYCRSNDEKEIERNVFELILAFDEIVALGYRENVNLAQIRTFTDMDSHEERVFNQIKIAQERAANEMMTQKANELKKLKAEQKKTGRGIGSNATAISSSSPSSIPLSSTVIDDTIRIQQQQQQTSSTTTTNKSRIGSGKALKLGSKTTDDDLFVKQLKSEGQLVTSMERSSILSSSSSTTATSNDHTSNMPLVQHLPVHIKSEEKLSAIVSRDGGLESCEILGSVSVLLTEPQFSTVSIQMKNNDEHGAQLQVHPNLDKKYWQQNMLLKLKSAKKPFPINVEVGVLKWRLQLTNEDALPITLNCWPNENPDGCIVNIEYTLQMEQMTLNNVVIVIPLPASTVPVVSECEGSYEYIKSKSQLIWTIAIIDESNKNGTLEFSTDNGQTTHFFPVTMRFFSNHLYCDIAVESVQKMESEESVNYSSESRFITDTFEVV